MAQGAGCLPRSSPEVRIVPVLAAPAFDDRKTLTELQAIHHAGNGGGHGVSHGHTPLGLTASKLMGRLRQDVTLQFAPGKRVCGYLNNLEIEVGFNDVQVLIAKDLPRRSCSYNEVLKHEMKHVNADRQYLQEVMPRVKKYWKEVAANIRVVSGPNRAAVEQQISSYLNAALEKLLAELTTERSAIQDQIDTPEEYRRVTYSCNGQIPQILKMRYGQAWLDNLMNQQQEIVSR
ncbi:MAG: hypothetical protein EBZ69_04525 [Alphaproteobacteria bacterium]|nr:hypothetical protein [Alphaproteobacteria bacterium]NDC56063.1 hypothetical protein [Alphaproteobacteria bacterium]NDG04101.1 hypothetical protein [Alphaproteobacteria bacterium]